MYDANVCWRIAEAFNFGWSGFNPLKPFHGTDLWFVIVTEFVALL